MLKIAKFGPKKYKELQRLNRSRIGWDQKSTGERLKTLAILPAYIPKEVDFN
jgi:hypothetical protein